MSRGDFGRQKPSDIGDVAPSNQIITDDDHISRGTIPVTDRGATRCCDMARRANDNARKALEQAERALTSIRNTANKQPNKPPEQCGGQQFTCTARVLVRHIIPTIVKKPNNGPLDDGPGATGRVVNNIENGTVCFTFNSAEAAKNFAAQKNAERDQKQAEYGYSNGKDDEFGVTFVSTDLGLQPPPNQTKRCQEPKVEDRALIGSQDNRIRK